jgi:hypothetical protein
MTADRKEFLRFELDDGRIKIFGDDNGLELMRRAPMWKCDGTFKSAPKGFTQVYTVHARHPRGETVPVLHVLMVRKTLADYRVVFNWLNAALSDDNDSIVRV